MKGLLQQSFPYELLLVDNTSGRVGSAARELNRMARQARYRYLVFVHQDVLLCSAVWLSDAVSYISRLACLGVAGVAGKNDKGLVASVTHGNPPVFVGPQILTKPVEVQTIDGCLAIVPRRIFQKVQFDETTTDGWYLYIANYCLDLISLGYRNYVLPLHVYHESVGPRDITLYERTVQKIIARHRHHTDIIYTTMGDWNTA